MLFGMQKPKGLFGGGLMQQLGQMPAGQNAMPAPPMQAGAALQGMQGMFGAQQAPQQPQQPHKGINWGHVLVDALSGAAGQEGPYAQMAMQKQHDERAAQAAAAERQASMQDWQSKYDYTQAHKVQEPDNFTRTLSASGIDPASPQGVAMFKKRAEMLTNPVQLVPDGYGGVRPVHVNGEMGASGPATMDDWNTATPQGGAGGNVSGGFQGF